MMRRLVLILLTASPSPAAAHVVRYDIDGAHSDVAAKVAFFGLSNKTAHFPSLHGGVGIDPARTDAMDLDVEIDARMLTAPDALTAERLKSERFFDVAHFPTIRFVGHHLLMTGDQSGTVSGELMARGVRRPAVLAVTFDRPPRAAGPGDANQLLATAEIDRRAFGMTAYPFIVGRTVTIRIAAHMVAAR